MNKIKEQFKKDFEESNNNVNLTFDVSQLEPNILTKEDEIRLAKERRKRRGKIIGIVSFSAVAIAVVAIPIASNINVNESVTTARRRLSVNASALAESNSVRKLNDISYPNSDAPIKNELAENEINAFNEFSNTTYHSLVNSSKEDNMSYATIGLYSILNELYGAISREDLQTQFDNLLGLNEESRTNFYGKVMKANSFVSQESTTQLKNAAFFDNAYDPNPEYINKLSKLYCECYETDLQTNGKKLVEWVEKAVDTKGFIDEKFLGMDQYTVLYYFSTLYFKNAWAYKYLAETNIEDTFYLSNGTTTQVTYMQHEFYTDKYYDYGSYISFSDIYMNRYATVTYIIPKDTKDNIFDLTRNVNIFEENIEKEVSTKHDEYYEPIIVNLKTPKFKAKSDLNFRTCFESLGFGDMFDNTIDSFHKAFLEEGSEGVRFYLQQAKQRNEVEFNEDGSIVKSLSMGAMGGDRSAEPFRNALNVDLNQPFIYIIKDINGVPILVGHVDDPKY